MAEEQTEPQEATVFNVEQATAPAPTEVAQPSVAPATGGSQEVEWQASEYLHHEKGAGWFSGLLLFGVGLSILLFFVVDWFSALVVLLMTAALSVYANRKPQVLNYGISYEGVTIGGRFYPFEDFRSFSVAEEGNLLSIVLLPLKRFMPPISIYFAPEDGDRIVEILSEALPHEDRGPDAMDRLIKKLRF